MERRFTPRPLRRKDVYPQAVVDGRPAKSGVGSGISQRVERLLTSRGEREEAQLEGELQVAGNLTRPNIVAVISPKGGVGKTSRMYVLGTLLASRKRLRVLAIDANPDFGTLASLAPEKLRSPHDAADLYEQVESVSTSAALRSYVTALPGGLHILAAPERPEVMADMNPDGYGVLLVFLAQFYDLLLLDMGTGIVDPLAQLGVSRADHVLLVTDQEFATANRVLGALRHLESAERDDPAAPFERLTVVLNIATLLAAIVVILGAGFVGSLLAGDDDGAVKAEQRRAQSASQGLDTVRGELSAAGKEAATQRAAQQRSNRKLKRARRRSARDARKISRLTRQLRRARRANR